MFASINNNEQASPNSFFSHLSGTRPLIKVTCPISKSDLSCLVCTIVLKYAYMFRVVSM